MQTTKEKRYDLWKWKIQRSNRREIDDEMKPKQNHMYMQKQCKSDHSMCELVLSIYAYMFMCLDTLEEFERDAKKQWNEEILCYSHSFIYLFTLS